MSVLSSALGRLAEQAETRRVSAVASLSELASPLTGDELAAALAAPRPSRILVAV